jgi:hypothetical protein
MKLSLLIKRIVYGGSSRLSPIEASLLQAVRGSLSPEESAALEEQLRDIETVQKTGGGRIVTVWYRSDARSRTLAGDEFCLARLRIEEEGRKSSVSVWTHRGRVQSIEYSRRPKKMCSVVSVEVRPEKATSAAATLDRLEHPNEETA